MLEYWTFSKEDFPSVQIQVERADTWLGRFCGLMMRKPLPHGSLDRNFSLLPCRISHRDAFR